MTPTERRRPVTRRRRLAHIGIGGVLAAVAGSQAGALIAAADQPNAVEPLTAAPTVREPAPPHPRPTAPRATRSHRRTHPLKLAATKPPPSFRPRPHPTSIWVAAEAWARSYFSVRVANCESGGGPNDRHRYYDGDPHLRDPNGHDGKWQFAPSTWVSVGGTGSAADATEAEQDYRAYLLWSRDGWGQWECAGMV